MRPNVELMEPILKLLFETKLISQRPEIVNGFSDYRTCEIYEMTMEERRKMLAWLEEYEVQTDKEKCIKKLFHLCHLYGWHTYDEKKEKHVVDVKSLNAWLVKYGRFHKELNKHNLLELSQVTSQFEKVVNQFLKTI
jgi:hypothetical protein